MLDIALEQFHAAREILKGKALLTPLVPFCTNFSQANPIFFKAENLQPSGSFKIRGATYCLSLLSPEQRKKGVIAYSTGNHAQAVALAAQLLGIKATIVMSPDVPEFKVQATKNYGAEVVIVPANERRPHAEELARSTGSYLVPPYDHPAVITGQGTIGLEILESMDPAAVFVPVGGGGLISGIAMAMKKSHSKAKIIGVEPELENDAWQSFESKTKVTLAKPSNSIADAVRVPNLGDLTFPLMMAYVDDMITVSEKQIAEATLQCLKTHMIVEPSGALSLAGALVYKSNFSAQKPVVCIASGGNTTLDFLCKLKDPISKQ
jgi:threonine dehydratase